MKLHDLKPAPGSRRPRTRVGRGIAAGQGKTAGRGTKGQKARAGGTIPPWFEGGQTPIHVRVPKLRGFKNRFKIQYAVVNVGQISAYAEAGRFGVEAEQPKAAKGNAADKAVVTVNAEVLANAGLIRGDDKPLKVLGQGEVGLKLFVAALAFSAAARQKIESAGGFVQILAEIPDEDIEGMEASAAAEVTSKAAVEAEAGETETAEDEPVTPARKAKAAAAKSAAPKAKAEPKTKASARSDAPETQEKPTETKPRRRATKSDENS
jgi:large subunit ribosomal protein L15